jgi:hypothetical protein
MGMLSLLEQGVFQHCLWNKDSDEMRSAWSGTLNRLAFYKHQYSLKTPTLGNVFPGFSFRQVLCTVSIPSATFPVLQQFLRFAPKSRFCPAENRLPEGRRRTEVAVGVLISATVVPIITLAQSDINRGH